MNNVVIAKSASTKYLGVTISHNLNWNQHCDNICNKANSMLRLLRRVLSDSPNRTSSARFVFRDYSSYTHFTPMLKQLGWDTLEQRRLSYQLSLFYKIQQGLVGISLPSEVHPLTGASRTRNAFPFRHIQTSCNVYKYSLYPSSIVTWNKLPVVMDTIPFTNSIMAIMNSMIRLI